MKLKFHILYLALIGATVLYYQKIAPTIATTTTVTTTPVSGQTGNYVPTPVEAPKPKIKTIFKKIFVPKTQYVYNTVEVPAKVDTAEILKSYYAKNYYSDTIKTKDTISHLKVVINDVVTQNKIIDRSVLYDYIIPTKTITTTVTPKPKGQLFAGVNVGQGLGASIAYKTPKDKMYDAGFMFNLRGNIFYISAKWKIGVSDKVPLLKKLE